MAIYLGIDGGGTKTACAVGDEQNVLGTAVSGGSNVLKLGEQRTREALKSAIMNACAVAKIDPKQVNSACDGVAGSSILYVRHFVQRCVAELVGGDVIVVGDNEIALEAACGGSPGVVVISGTGSIAYGRDENGETARAGGHGAAVSDEGSGYWIGRSAVSAVLRALDRGNETLLFRKFGDVLGARSRDELVKIANGSPGPDFDKLFPAVNSAAEANDPTAIGVLNRAAAELSELARIVIHRLWPDAREVRLGVAGGVFEHSSVVRQEFKRHLFASSPQAKLEFPVANPVLGALAIARKAGSEARAKAE